MALKSYRELKVWTVGMDIAASCYHLTKNYPKEERFGMTSQILRSASRIPANIAEGYGRGHRPEYLQLETHLLLSERVQLASADEVKGILAMCDEESRMLASQIRALQK
jgi:four helix bundle protein